MKPLAGLLTVALGIAAAYFFTPDKKTDETEAAGQTVSVCQIALDPESYLGREVRVTAGIHIDKQTGEAVLSDPACGSDHFYADCPASYGSCHALLTYIETLPVAGENGGPRISFSGTAVPHPNIAAVSSRGEVRPLVMLRIDETRAVEWNSFEPFDSRFDPCVKYREKRSAGCEWCKKQLRYVD